MQEDRYTGGPSADTYGLEPPPSGQPFREHPVESDPRYDAPAYDDSAYESTPRGRYQPPRYVRWIGGALILCAVLLLVCGGAAAVVAGIALNSTPASATVDKTFPVSGAPSLIVHGAIGSVHVTAGSANAITLHATKEVHTLTHAQSQSELDAITIRTSQTGNVVTITVEDSSSGLHFFDSRQIDLDITAPAITSLNLVENAGTLDASGITGKLTIRVNAGAVTLDNMTIANGSSLRVNAGSLSVDGSLQSGASLLIEVNAGSADVTLPQNTSAHLDASATAGSVSINGWNIAESQNGPNTTASGDLNPHPTSTITIRVTAGDASLNAA